MGNLRYLGLGFLALLLFFAVEAPAQISSKVFLEGGRIIPVNGPILEKGSILIEDGRIVAIGRDLKAPFDARVHDVTGKTLFPGMIDAFTASGLDRANENLDVVPYVDVMDAIDPSQRYFEEALRAGITSIHISQGVNCVIAGMSRVVHPIGMTVAEMTQNPLGGLMISLFPKGGYDHAVQRAILRDTFADLKRYLDRRAEELYMEKLKEEKKDEKPTVEEARRKGRALIKADKLEKKYRNLYLLTQGKLDTVLYAGRAMDVEAALKLAEAQGFKDNVTLLIGSECYKVARALKALKRPVILRPGDMIHRELDRITEEEKDTFVPEVLSRNKVPFAIGSTQEPWYEAARCVRNGVKREEALRAITINAARAIGMEHLVGSLEKGKMANILVLSGDPLDAMTWVEQVFVQGQLVYERSKDKRLRDIMDGIHETSKEAKKAATEKKPAPSTATKKDSGKSPKSKKD